MYIDKYPSRLDSRDVIRHYSNRLSQFVESVSSRQSSRNLGEKADARTGVGTVSDNSELFQLSESLEALLAVYT